MKILEVFLLSTDIPASTSFYTDVLGLPVLQESTSAVSFKAGETILHFNQGGNIKPVYHFAFNIPSNQLEPALEFLKTKTEVMPASGNGDLVADFKSWNAQSFYFNDNNGNILECIARFDLNNPATDWDPEAFILNVNEIAFVVTNIPETQKYLLENGIPLFSKGPQTADFSVLGDEEGLIILKDLKSGWMPNDLEPKPFETRVIIQEDQQAFKLNLSNESLRIEKVSKH